MRVLLIFTDIYQFLNSFFYTPSISIYPYHSNGVSTLYTTHCVDICFFLLCYCALLHSDSFKERNTLLHCTSHNSSTCITHQSSAIVYSLLLITQYLYNAALLIWITEKENYHNCAMCSSRTCRHKCSQTTGHRGPMMSNGQTL